MVDPWESQHSSKGPLGALLSRGSPTGDQCENHGIRTAPGTPTGVSWDSHGSTMIPRESHGRPTGQHYKHMKDRWELLGPVV